MGGWCQCSRRAPGTQGEIDSLRVLGILEAQVGQFSQAEGHLRESIELSIEHNVRYWQGLALLELGRLYQRQVQIDQAVAGDWRAKAQQSLNEAAEIFETLGAGHDLQLTRQALSLL